jgi:hypothetical protein
MGDTHFAIGFYGTSHEEGIRRVKTTIKSTSEKHLFWVKIGSGLIDCIEFFAILMSLQFFIYMMVVSYWWKREPRYVIKAFGKRKYSGLTKTWYICARVSEIWMHEHSAWRRTFSAPKIYLMRLWHTVILIIAQSLWQGRIFIVPWCLGFGLSHSNASYDKQWDMDDIFYWLIIYCFTSHSRIFTCMEKSLLPVKDCKI